MTKKEYHFYKRMDICVRCHKEKAEPNRVMCEDCAEKERKRSTEVRAKCLKEKREKELKLYYELKEKGVCVYCKRRKAIPGKTKCQYCLAKIRNRRNEKNEKLSRSEWVSYGLCYLCGKNEIMDGKRVCKKCYQKRLECAKKIMHLPVSEHWKCDNDIVFMNRN